MCDVAERVDITGIPNPDFFFSSSNIPAHCSAPFYTSNVKMPAIAVNKNALTAQAAICPSCSQQSDIGAMPCHTRGNNARKAKTRNMLRAVFTLVIFSILSILCVEPCTLRFSGGFGMLGFFVVSGFVGSVRVY